MGGSNKIVPSCWSREHQTPFCEKSQFVVSIPQRSNIVPKDVLCEFLKKFLSWLSSDNNKTQLNTAVRVRSINSGKELPYEKTMLRVHQDVYSENISSNPTLTKSEIYLSFYGLENPSLPTNFASFAYILDKESLTQPSWTLVTGQPGSGKTTFLKWIGHEMKIAFYLNLRDERFFSSGIHCCKNTSKFIRKIVMLQVPSPALRQILLQAVRVMKRTATFLVDGLDEIPAYLTEENVKQVLKHLREFSTKMEANVYIASRSAARYKEFFVSSQVIDVSKILAVNCNLTTIVAPVEDQSTLMDHPDDAVLTRQLDKMKLKIEKISPHLLKAPTKDTISAKFDAYFDALTIEMIIEDARKDGHSLLPADITDYVLRQMRTAMKMAHINMAVKEYFPKFKNLIRITISIFIELDDKNFESFGLMENNGHSLRFVHSSYPEYLLAEYITSYATSSIITPNIMQPEAASLFVEFVLQPTSFDAQAVNSFPVLTNFRYDIMHEKLGNKKVTDQFIGMLQKEILSRTDSNIRESVARTLHLLVDKKQSNLLKWILQTIWSMHDYTKIILEARKYADNKQSCVDVFDMFSIH